MSTLVTPVSWCFPCGPGIVTLRSQPVADDKQQHFPQSPANKTHLRASHGGAAVVVRRARILKKDLGTSLRSTT